LARFAARALFSPLLRALLARRSIGLGFRECSAAVERVAAGAEFAADAATG
jgi:hypothetical protein